ncbi:CAP domain-containing protein [Ohtaekwangia kribbensis]|jgi:uncharacterized protein YkwD|uniref:CAP domain-containing protein n=1 Tax=Ohtaekwangia kribbensis TaxID=688913 RepID=A0ABW3K178_9BACT
MKSFVLASFLLLSMSAFDTRPFLQLQEEELCLSTEEMKLYRLIMEYRKTKGLPSIPLSAKLSQVANVHAHDLADNYKFDPDNKCNPHSWSKKGSWTACCYTSDHKRAQCMWDKPKEIAGYSGFGYEIAYYSTAGATAQEGLDGWKVSPGHNPLIVNLDIWSKVKWNAIGVALYKEYGLVWFGEEKDDTTVKTCK